MDLPSRDKGGKADIIFPGERTIFRMYEGAHASAEKAKVRATPGKLSRSSPGPEPFRRPASTRETDAAKSTISAVADAWNQHLRLVLESVLISEEREHQYLRRTKRVVVEILPEQVGSGQTLDQEIHDLSLRQTLGGRLIRGMGARSWSGRMSFAMSLLLDCLDAATINGRDRC
jgi:hypothetical protein